MKKYLFLLFLSFIFSWSNTYAQSADSFIADKEFIGKGEVVRVLKEETLNLPETNIIQEIQILNIKILDGEQENKEVIVENDYQKLKKGDYLFENNNEFFNGERPVFNVEPYSYHRCSHFYIFF
jgi:hypothetical protein